MRLHLNAFRGEPAISAFDWHFTRLPTAPPSHLQLTPVRASTGSYTRFPLAMGRSRSFGSVNGNKNALFGLAFARPACRKHLSGRRQQLAGSLCKRHAVTPLRRGRLRLFAGNLVSGSVSLPSRGAFHLSLTVLVRYRWRRVFSLGGWSPRIPARFLVSRSTRVSSRANAASHTGLSPPTVRRSRQFLRNCADPILTTPQPRRASPSV